jgi:hypothetical protein
VHEYYVGISTARGIERLARALRHHLDVNSGLGFKQRQEVVEQPGILRRGGRGDHDRLLCGDGLADQCDADNGDNRPYPRALARHTSSSPERNFRASTDCGALKKDAAAEVSMTRPW